MKRAGGGDEADVCRQFCVVNSTIQTIWAILCRKFYDTNDLGKLKATYEYVVREPIENKAISKA